jgi:hypothetical protein
MNLTQRVLSRQVPLLTRVRVPHVPGRLSKTVKKAARKRLSCHNLLEVCEACIVNVGQHWSRQEHDALLIGPQ